MELGEEITARPLRQLESGNWLAEARRLPAGWNAIIILKNKEQKLKRKRDTFWVFNIDRQESTVALSRSDFGRLPISDRMRPRYISALRDLCSFLKHSQESVELDSISEVKGMVNRCLRKDQWDWLSVYEAFGKPSLELLGKLPNVLSSLRDSVKENQRERTKRGMRKLQKLNASQLFLSALANISESAPDLDGGRELQPKSAETRDTDGEEYVVAKTSKKRRITARRKHRQTLRVLCKTLEELGYKVEESKYIDAFCRLRSGPAVFEVKSTSSPLKKGA